MNSASQQLDADAAAGTKVRPPFLFLGALLLGFALDHLLPLPRPVPGTGPAHLISAIVAGVLILVGVVLFAAAIRNFVRAGTPVPGNQPARTLVTTGIHGWSRNPVYAGMLLSYLGIGLAVRSSWILILVLPAFIVLRHAVVAREEAYLERRFGEAYRDYKARVRRWV